MRVRGNFENSEIQDISNHSLSLLPCPADADIYPCTCTVESGSTMDMNCSAVESEQQLMDVFASYIPFPIFRKLIIQNNPNLTVLKAGTFGESTFQEFHITSNELENVEMGALSGSFETGTKLFFSWNKITNFPFEEMLMFTNLESLQIGQNRIVGVPDIQSETLKQLYLNSNPLGSVPITAFNKLPSIEDISLSDSGLHDISAGKIKTFIDGNLTTPQTRQIW